MAAKRRRRHKEKNNSIELPRIEPLSVELNWTRLRTHRISQLTAKFSDDKDTQNSMQVVPFQ